MATNHEFCRHYLRRVMADVNDAGYRAKQAWAWKSATGVWEFHGPNDFYYICSHSDCSYSAKAEGWEKYLEHLEQKTAAS